MSRRQNRSRIEISIHDRIQAFRHFVVAQLGGLSLALLGAWLIFAIASYSISDSSLNTATLREPVNWMGSIGALVSDALLQFFGGAAFLFCPPLIIWGVVAFLRGKVDDDSHVQKEFWVRTSLFVVALVLFAVAFSVFPVPATQLEWGKVF